MICLNMIVKNEAKIIERCLASCLPLISSYVICDTGSTDGTQDIIPSFFEKHGIPGELHSIPFEDFSQARNVALERCRASDQPFDWILLTDADMELVIDELPQLETDKPVRLLVQKSATYTYSNRRLLHRHERAHYEMPTHEYLSTEHPPILLEDVWFRDHSDGSSRSEKNSRDIRLLTMYLEEHPRDARSLFYLARAYFDSRDFPQALQWYGERIRSGGSSDEVWQSAWMIARCYQEMKDTKSFILACLEAYDRDTSRAEPLHALSRHFRQGGKNSTAFHFADAASKLFHPPHSALFVEHAAYGYGLQHEIAVTGFYNPKTFARGQRACFDLTVDKAAPLWIRDLSRSNASHYAKPLFKQEEVQEIVVPRPEGYELLNPSITAFEGRLFGIVRSVNYRMHEGKYVPEWNLPESVRDKTIRTTNIFAEFNGDLSVKTSFVLEDKTSYVKHPFPVKGLEDCRLFRHQDAWHVSATVRDSTAKGTCEQLLARVDLDSRALVDGRVISKGPKHEKNWVPLMSERGCQGFIYGADPLVVLDMEGKETSRQSVKMDLTHLRGSSQAISFFPGETSWAMAPNTGWLYVTHEVVSSPRKYMHRFVFVGINLHVNQASIQVSDPFYFLKPGIEFCAGMARSGDDLIVSFGVEDIQAFLAKIPIQKVFKMLNNE